MLKKKLERNIYKNSKLKKKEKKNQNILCFLKKNRKPKREKKTQKIF